MKSFFKKSAISLIVMGMAGASYAGHTANYNSYGMWSPNFNGWFIGIEGLDLRPMNGDLDYVAAASSSLASSAFISSISPGYQWSWRLYGGVKFTDNDDITLSWTRMRADDNNSFNNFADVFVTPRFLFSSTWDTVSGSVDFDLDDIYGVWGHTINFNNPWTVRFAWGFDYVKLNSDMSVGAVFFGDGSAGVTQDSHLKGFGPRVEFDMTYHFMNNFAVFANANAVLFASERKISTTPFIDGEDVEFLGDNFSTRHVVVPKFGMRVGASYSWIFGQGGGEGGAVSALTIDAGWQVDSYVHAIERIDLDDDFAETKVSNFGDQGFFIGLKYSTGWL